MPITAQADTRDDILTELHELCEDDFILEEIALAIINKESNFKNIPNYLYDGESGKYTAFGIFQITKTTFKEKCGQNPILRKQIKENLKCGISILKDGEFYRWNESKYGKNGWHKKLSLEARLRIKGFRIVSLNDKPILIDKKGNIVDSKGKLWTGIELPFLD